MNTSSSLSPSWLPPNSAAHGVAFDHLLHWNLAIFGACFLLAHLLLVIVLVRRPQRTGPGSSVTRTWRLQALPITFFCLLYLALAVTAQRLWATQHYEGAAPGSMQVEVTGRQFQWYFRYPGADATFGGLDPAMIQPANGNPLGLIAGDEYGRDDIVSSELVLPVDREVDLTLRAQDVIHGLFIPGMRVKQNAVPGLTLHVHFTPEIAGEYPILCSQVCGLGHGHMQARLRVVAPVEFESWRAERERRRLAQSAAAGGAQ